jgi:hypothetical protein
VKRLFLSLVIAIAVIAITTGILAWVSLQPPAWYAPPDFTDPEVAKLADRAEYRLNEEFHKIRPEEEVWRVRMNDDVMNAWLSGRLEGWLTHDQEMTLPAEIHEPQVHLTRGGIWTYAQVEISQGSPRPLGIKWWVWVDEDNVLIEPIGVRIGNLPLPMALFETQIQKLREEVTNVRAEIPLLDDRIVEVQHIALENGALVLTCRTTLN